MGGGKHNKWKVEYLCMWFSAAIAESGKELRKTAYIPKLLIPGSRAKLGFNDGIYQYANINKEWKKLTNNNLWTFYN